MRFCLPCITTNTPILTRRVPTFCGKHMNMALRSVGEVSSTRHQIMGYLCVQSRHNHVSRDRRKAKKTTAIEKRVRKSLIGIHVDDSFLGSTAVVMKGMAEIMLPLAIAGTSAFSKHSLQSHSYPNLSNRASPLTVDDSPKSLLSVYSAHAQKSPFTECGQAGATLRCSWPSTDY